MSIEAFTPDYGRIASASALDFVFWALTSYDTALDRNGSVFEFDGGSDDEEASVRMVVDAAEQVDITLVSDFDGLKSNLIADRGRIPLAKALRTRGALLFRRRGVAISLGDRKRILEVREGEIYSRYLNSTERMEGFWDETLLITGMVYL